MDSLSLASPRICRDWNSDEPPEVSSYNLALEDNVRKAEHQGAEEFSSTSYWEFNLHQCKEVDRILTSSSDSHHHLLSSLSLS